MTNPRITREETASGGRLIAQVDDKTGEAEMTWSGSGDTLRIVDHTAVPDTLRGTGVGKALGAHG